MWFISCDPWYALFAAQTPDDIRAMASIVWLLTMIAAFVGLGIAMVYTLRILKRQTRHIGRAERYMAHVEKKLDQIASTLVELKKDDS